MHLVNKKVQSGKCFQPKKNPIFMILYLGDICVISLKKSPSKFQDCKIKYDAPK